MSIYLYLHQEGFDFSNQRKKCEDYVAQKGLQNVELLLDSMSTKLNWRERLIGELIEKMKPRDQLIVYEAAHLACSTSQVIEILNRAAERRLPLHFVKHGAFLSNETDVVNTYYILNLISKVESDFISKRTSQALARRKAAGLPLGRPKGRSNKSLKLDKYKMEIQKYVALGISKASIAKLVDCHPQTLYDWLEKNELTTNEETSIS